MRWNVVALSLALMLGGTGSLGGQSWVEFVDATATQLVGPVGLTVDDPDEKNFAWGDVDQDGDLDLIVARKIPYTQDGGRPNALFLNEAGVLTESTAAFASDSDVAGDTGFLTPTTDRDVILVDVDNDGWLDVVTACALADGAPKHISHPRVYQNLGEVAGVWQGFQYQDARIPQLAGLAASGFPHAPRFIEVAAGDVDGDGDIDLFFTDHDAGGPQTFDFNDRLLLNDGNGFFADATTTALTGTITTVGPTYPFPQSGFGSAGVIADLDGDGANDILKMSTLNPPQVLAVAYNDLTSLGVFSEVDVVYDFAGYHFDVGDLNNDGLLDIVVADDGADRYLLNQGVATGSPTFTNQTFDFTSGGDDGFGGDVVIADLDLDGFDDVLIADASVDIPGCNRRLHAYHNQGDVPDVTLLESGVAEPWLPTGVHDVAVFDLDGDGWLDLVIGRCTGIEVWTNVPPNALTFSYPNGRPELVPCSGPATFQVEVGSTGTVVPVAGSLEFWVSTDGAPFVPLPVTDLGAGLYEASLPTGPLGTDHRYYFTADIVGGGSGADPVAAPTETYRAIVADGLSTVASWDFESPAGDWTIETGIDLTAGAWEQAIPNGTQTAGLPAAPSTDTTPDPGVAAFVTGNGLPGGSAGDSDVDGGFNWLTSPTLNATGTGARVSWSVWVFNNDTAPAQVDALGVWISNDDGLSWLLIDIIGTTVGWESRELIVSDHITPTDLVRVRLSISDFPNNSITEAAIDDFAVEVLACGVGPSDFIRGDINQDGDLDVSDPVVMLGVLFAGAAVPSCLQAMDANDDDTIDVSDPVYALAHLFSMGDAPPSPYPGCGPDPSGGALSCAEFTPCP